MSTQSARIRALLVLGAVPLLLGAWTLSDNGVAPKQSPWNPKGKAVLKSPDGVRLVIRSAFCSFGRHGGVRLRFGGKPTTTDVPYIQLVAQRRERSPSVLDIFDGVINLPPKWGWAGAMHVGTAHVQVARRRGTFALFRDGDDVATDTPRYTGTWDCG